MEMIVMITVTMMMTATNNSDSTWVSL